MSTYLIAELSYSEWKVSDQWCQPAAARRRFRTLLYGAIIQKLPLTKPSDWPTAKIDGKIVVIISFGGMQNPGFPYHSSLICMKINRLTPELNFSHFSQTNGKPFFPMLSFGLKIKLNYKILC